MIRLLRAPLFHFLAGGALLFGLLALFASERGPEQTAFADSRAIVVEHEALLAFVQSRTKLADAREVARSFEALDAYERSKWIERFVREEALVREARALGLDRGDELIRRRLVQKIEFLTLGAIEEGIEITPGELAAWYREHAEDYRVATTLTFTHVFIRVDSAGPDDEAQSRARAEALLARLNAERISFRDALPLGDRFLYNRNYVDRTLEEVRSHFGDGLAEALVEASVASDAEAGWTGPHRSEHGWHLVLLTRRTDSALPPLDAIADRLREEIRRERREAALAAAVGEIVSHYRVELEAPPAHEP